MYLFINCSDFSTCALTRGCIRHTVK